MSRGIKPWVKKVLCVIRDWPSVLLDGGWAMDAKLLLLIALLAPVLMLAAGIFARWENAGENTENGHPEDPGKNAHLAPVRRIAQAASSSEPMKEASVGV